MSVYSITPRCSTRIHLVLGLLLFAAVLLLSLDHTLAFSFSKVQRSTRSSGSRSPRCCFSQVAPARYLATDSPESDDNNNEEEEEDRGSIISGSSDEDAPTPPSNSVVSKKPLDPLIASLTRTDATAENTKTVRAPLFGEVPLDGSLVVLLPAIVIGLVGFVMSLVVIVNSQDAIVDTLTRLSDDVTATALAKTNSLSSSGGMDSGDGCRGLCSSQDADLENLKVFMEGLSGVKK